jgi:hydroxysqualene dehydroxylase
VAGVRCSSGDILHGRAYVCTLPPQEMLALLPSALRDALFFQGAAGLGTSPIVNIHLWYDRPVMDFPFAAFVGSDLQWVFNKSKMCPSLSRGPGQHLDISLSGAGRYIDQPNRALAERFTREVQRVLPRARRARLEGWLVVKQAHATFAAAPGSAKHRLPARTPVANLFLAGDWTATGWPATMESAVRSGLACANEILRTTALEKGGEATGSSVAVGTQPSGTNHPSSEPRHAGVLGARHEDQEG